MTRSASVFLLLLAMILPTQPLLSEDPAPSSGRPTVVDLPDLERFGQRLPVPDGWDTVQANADTLEGFRTRFGVERVPALVYVDRYGNVLHRDEGEGCTSRLRAGIAEFERRRRELEERIQKLAREAADARQAGKEEREIPRVIELAKLAYAGYPDVTAARTRRDELNRGRSQALLRILAGEGIVPDTRVIKELRELATETAGLPVAAIAERERQRIERGVRVEKRPRGS